MKFVSFNVNGLRARLHQISAVIDQLRPDVIGLQETKVKDEYFPIQEISRYGYYAYYSGQKQYNGVALLFQKPPLNIIQNTILHNDYNDVQKRIIGADIKTAIGTLTIINSYCPQGENKNHLKKFTYKKQFFQNLKNFINNNYHNRSLLLIMGDMNISPTDLDVGIDEYKKKRWLKLGKCSFLPEERKWIDQLINWGLIDIYRYAHPKQNKRYSWFDYKSNGFNKNIGLRIDLILTTHPLIHYYKDSNIDYKIRAMIRPSDHAPVWADFNI